MYRPTAKEYEQELKRLQYNKEYKKTLKNVISTLVVVAAISVLLATFFFPFLQVIGTSMEPNLYNGDILVSIKSDDVKQGDIIAFYYNNKVLLKRVIAKAGQVVDILDDGTVLVDGIAIEEPYLNEKSFGNGDIEYPYQVPDGRVFVLGDHRSTSMDSRNSSIGCIADEYIVGKVIYRIWPLNKLGTIK